jgi:mono/diheme cytochrome c family protein
MRYAALLLVIGLAAACSQSLDFERMREQKRASAYAVSMRTPPAGTVAVSDRKISLADVSVERGRHVYDIYCALCHGESTSVPSVMAANMPGTPPPSLTMGEAAQRSAAEMFEVVSHGKNRMPAYDWALTEEDRWAVVAHVKSR